MESNLTTPAIVIFTSADCADVWNDVLLGIEEEGIPFVIQENDSTDVIHNAWLAACQSPLLAVAVKNWSCTTKTYPHQHRFLR